MYDYSGDNIVFSSYGEYNPNTSYRIQNTDDSEVYKLNLSNGKVNQLTNNSFFDGYSNLFSPELGFNIMSNNKSNSYKIGAERYKKIKESRLKWLEKLKKSKKIK